jgi:hypothetical protein
VRTENSPIGGERHYYKLTERGTEVLSSKKFDWVYSKLLIDNLVLDKKLYLDQEAKEKEAISVILEQKPQSNAAAKVERFIGELTDKIKDNQNIAAMSNTATANEDYITIPLHNAQQKHFQIAYDMSKVETLQEAPQTTLLKPFVKHNGDKKCGKFVFYNRLKFACSMITTLALIGVMSLCSLSLKENYTSQESNFFMVGWIAIGVYLLSNVVIFSAYPKYKQVVDNKVQGLVRRGIFSFCLCVTAVSINVIAGLSSINASDFLVYCTVPCIVGSVFLLEGLAIWALRKVPFFLS